MIDVEVRATNTVNLNNKTILMISSGNTFDIFNDARISFDGGLLSGYTVRIRWLKLKRLDPFPPWDPSASVVPARPYVIEDTSDVHYPNCCIWKVSIKTRKSIKKQRKRGNVQHQFERNANLLQVKNGMDVKSKS